MLAQPVFGGAFRSALISATFQPWGGNRTIMTIAGRWADARGWSDGRAGLAGGETTMSNKSHNRRGILGAAIVPHAPQFLTLPETEGQGAGRPGQPGDAVDRRQVPRPRPRSPDRLIERPLRRFRRALRARLHDPLRPARRGQRRASWAVADRR